MGHTSLRALVSASALVLSLTIMAWADCAPFVTSSEGDLPMMGTLVGTDSRTTTTTTTTTTTVEVKGGAGGVSGGGSTTTTTTTTTSRTYDVGTYDFGGGVRIQLDCSTYTIV